MQLQTYDGQYNDLACFLVENIVLPLPWQIIIASENPVIVTYYNSELGFETNEHPLKAYFQALIDRDALLEEEECLSARASEIPAQVLCLPEVI